MCRILFISFIISCIIWYAFFYCLLHSIKRDVNLYVHALLLVVLFSLSIVTCPIILYTSILPMYKELKMSCFNHK